MTLETELVGFRICLSTCFQAGSELVGCAVAGFYYLSYKVIKALNTLILRGAPWLCCGGRGPVSRSEGDGAEVRTCLS